MYPRFWAAIFLILITSVFAYALVTKRGIVGQRAPQYYPPTEKSQKAFAELQEKARLRAAQRDLSNSEKK